MHPPRLARLLLLSFVPSERRAEIDGDLHEGFLVRAERDGVRSASWWYRRQLFTVDVLRLSALHASSQMPAGPGPFSHRQERGAMLLHDVRHAFRSLARNRLYPLAVVSILGIGIGAVTAVFTLVNGVLLKPLPYRDADRLVMAFRTVPRFGFTRSTVSYPDYVDWRQVSVFETLAAYTSAEGTYHGADGAETWRGYRVTGNLFPMLGVAPLVGRAISDADAEPGAAAVVALSHSLWQSRFGGRADITGQSVRLGDATATIIGVMPPGFAFPTLEADFWAPLRVGAGGAPRDMNFLSVLGRLAPGATVETAQRELAAVAARIDREAPEANEGYGVFVEARRAFMVRDARTGLIAFQLTVILVLALACGCVANLMLTRAASRRRELAVRTALGATRGRLLRQLLTESVLLSAGGGLAGVALAYGLHRLVLHFGAGQLPRLHEISIDGTVLLLTAGTAIVCGLICGLAPALHAGSEALAQSARGEAGSHRGRGARHRLQDGLIVLQFALTAVLLIGTGLVGASFLRLTAVEPGFDPAGVVAGRLSISASTPDALAARERLLTALAARVVALPGVVASGATYSLPFTNFGFSSQMLPEGTVGDVDESPTIQGSTVLGDYFAAIGVPLLSGRNLGPEDRSDAPRVMIVSRSLADRFWPGRDPLGQRVRDGNDADDVATVVGVVADVHQRSLAEPPAPMFYVPLSQAPWSNQMHLVVRTTGDPAALVPLIRRELRAIDPALPLKDVTVASQLIERTVAAPRFRALAFLVLGVFAVILALAGVYGIVSLGVTERRREIGVRMALGAGSRGVIALIVRRGVMLALVGVVVGLAGAVAATRVLASFLFGVAPHDAVIYLGVAIALLFVAATASLLPARRAAQIDPLISLRDA